ncbi:MAG TPA: radical SAM protein [Candidatus Cloacimonadota bacterium]|nr:radical SAM protein [Candidatus Cloacimonadota bacterium]HPS38206.1 radical SAM protein [Candidatus Cloacimonadota bacterium]
MKEVYRQRFDNNILKQFRKALQLALRNPLRLRWFFIHALWQQYRATRLRQAQLKEGLEVPPLLIISITQRCNLNCAGCYSKVLHQDSGAELTASRFREILGEAQSLGISIILLAGGEPLIRRDLLNVAAEFPQIIFPVFTNAMLLNAEYIRFFEDHPHLIPVVSLEGRELETDARRGDGVYANFERISGALKAHKLFWGISLTLSSPAYDLLLSKKYLSEYLANGCQLFFFVEYVPIDPRSKHLVLSPAQKQGVQARVDDLCELLPGLFIAFPGDEEQYGGCLAAGRGFMHINPTGMVEPCPFAPYSDTDLRQASLKDALRSKLLHKIRDQHHLLKETEGGCALWANRDALELPPSGS